MLDGKDLVFVFVLGSYNLNALGSTTLVEFLCMFILMYKYQILSQNIVCSGQQVGLNIAM